MCVEKTPWEQVIDFHGHTCPEIAIGFRVAQIAAREMGIRPTSKSELLVTADIHSCAIDAFQILNHATYGRGTLQVKEKQQHVYHFQYSETSEELQITVQSGIIELLTGIHEYSNSREKQNRYLEAIQKILGTDEALFCTLQKC
jgi:formylmethanofuran dehydrogenase subunit E